MTPRTAAGLGIFVMLVTGLVITAEMAISWAMARQGWPFWHTSVLGMAVSTIILFASICVLWPERPDHYYMKWVVLRGMCGATYWGLSAYAVQLGTSPGDVGALMSVNVAVAALLGRWFLGEPFGIAHLLAILSATAGVALISRPSFVFGDAGGGASPSWAGNLLAILAGVLQSAAFICSRQVAEFSVLFSTFSCLISATAVCLLLPAMKLADEVPVEVMWNSPGVAVAWVTASTAIGLAGYGFAVLGATLCPVAVSTTVYTSGTMTFGYLAEILFLGTSPGPAKVVGAALMVVAVGLMAVGGRRIRESPERQLPDGRFSNTQSLGSLESSGSGSLGLASFVFSELTDFKPASESATRRMSERRLSMRESARRDSTDSYFGNLGNSRGSSESGGTSRGAARLSWETASAAEGTRVHESPGAEGIPELPEESAQGPAAGGLEPPGSAPDGHRLGASSAYLPEDAEETFTI